MAKLYPISTAHNHDEVYAKIGESGVTDHGLLTGLGDNDHPQYLLTTGKAADSDKLDGLDSTDFATAGHDHDTDYLGISAKAADSDKLDGNDSTYFQPLVANTQWLALGYNRATDGPAYIDFHTINDKKDYDTRILASGGTSSNGGGTMAFYGSGFSFTSSAQLSAGTGYFAGNVSALSFTDRTPFYEGNALAEIKKIKGTATGKGKKEIDHSSLPDFVKVKKKNEDGIETDERDLGAMISVLTVAVQQLIEKVEALENKKQEEL